MKNSIYSLLFFLLSVGYVFPAALYQAGSIIVRESIVVQDVLLLIIAIIYSRMYLNLRRDRLDVSKHRDLLEFVKRFNDCDFKLIETKKYFDSSKLSAFLNSSETSNLLGKLVKIKNKKFINSRIRVVLILPREDGSTKEMPSGLKTFASYNTHQTTIFTTDHYSKLNPLIKFYLNHELGHMHKNAMDNLTLKEVGIYPFLWASIWIIFNSEWNVFFFLFLALYFFICTVSGKPNTDTSLSSDDRLNVEIAADYIGLKLLSSDEIKHKVFSKLKLVDPELPENLNNIRMKQFKEMLKMFKVGEKFELKSPYSVSGYILCLVLMVIGFTFFNSHNTYNSIKFGICLCAIVQMERFTNHREINRILRKIHERTNLNLSRWKEI